MDHKEFALFLAKLKELKISNKRFANFVGYNASSISCYASGDRKLPKVLAEAVRGLQFKIQLGIDLRNII
jgi:predicted transcriptional regulator